MPQTTPAAPAAGAPARPFGAVLTAMVTPFDAEGALDTEDVGRVAAHLVDAGCDGLVVNGTTGESATTTDAEQDAVLRATLAAVGDRAHVLAGVGTASTAHTVELARAAERAGAHGLLVVTPYYSKPPQEGLLAHFRTVADATSLPCMLYDIPGRTAVAIAEQTLLALAEHDRVVAVKDAKNDLAAASRVMAATDLAWYSGEDALNLAHLAQGAAGIVSVVAHAAAGHYARMVAAVDAGDLPTARSLHAQLLPALDAIMNRTQGAITATAVMQLLGVTPHRTVRLPLVPATDDQVSQLRDGMTRAGLL